MTIAFKRKNIWASFGLAVLLVVFCFSIGFSLMVAAQSASVTLLISPVGSGSIKIFETNQTISSTTNLTLDSGDPYGLTAVPNSGYNFSSWSATGLVAVDNSKSASTNMYVNGSGTVTATFTPLYQVSFAASGGGSSTTLPSGIQTYAAGQLVAITAHSASGYSFVSWNASSTSISFASSTSASTTATINGPGTVTASFTQPVVVTFAAIGGGGSTISPFGTQNYIAGQQVMVTANPASGYGFSGWSASPSSAVTFASASSDSTMATIAGSATITAKFVLNPTPTPIVTPRPPVVAPGTTATATPTSSPSPTPIPSPTPEPSTTPTPTPIPPGGSFTTPTLPPITPNPTPEISPTPTQSPIPSTINTLEVSTVLIVVIAAVLLGAGYFISYLSRPSLKKFGRDLQKRHEQEIKKDEQEKKDKERQSLKRKPFLKLEVTVPSMLWGSKSATVEGKVLNEGVAFARDVQVSALATPGLVFSKSAEKISVLRPLEEKPLSFPLTAGNRLKRGNYKLRFEVKSKETSRRVKDRSLRAMKIGLLSDGGGGRNLVCLRQWLGDRGVAWDELVGADNFTRLLQFDLLVVAYESELPSKWVKNISNFVDESQSLLVINKVNASNSRLISQTLGYDRMEFEDYGSAQRSLVVLDNSHGATKTMPMGTEMPLCGLGTVCTSNVDRGLALAKQTINGDGEKPSKDFPAIVANNYGEGRAVYLNFCLEQPLPQKDKLFENIFNWLIFENTTCALDKAEPS